MYLFSVDGGGTKTQICVLQLPEKKLCQFSFGSTNYKAAGYERAKKNMHDSFRRVCRDMHIDPEEILGVVLGISGCDTREDYRIYKDMAGSLGVSPERIHICNDSELLLLSAAEAPGICVISGTGSIAVGYGRTGGIIRCGGWGSPLSDAGSGYWIGEQVLREWIRYCDGQREFQPVFDRLRQYYSVTAGERVPYFLTRLSGSDIASAAFLISNMAEEGDPFCREAVQAAAEQVADIAGVVYDRLGLKKEPRVDLVMSGSIFNGWFYTDCFRKRLEQKVGKTGLICKKLEESPAQAGIRLAKKKFLKGEAAEKSQEREE